ncbi:MAG: hypothetical protein ACTSQK_09975 [Candidatus Heimdallarchaeota archaeon]
MTGYGGYGLQALTQGFQSGFSMAQQAKQMREKRKEKEELKKRKEALALVVGDIQTKAEGYARDGWTGQEVGDFGALIHASDIEVQDYFKGYLASIESGDRERIEEYKKLIDEFTAGLGDLDYSDMQKAYDAFSPNIKSEDGKKYLDVNYKMKQSIAQQQKPKVEVEYLPSIAAGIEKYGENADFTLVAGKGFVYTGEKRGTDIKSSDYVNVLSSLNRLAASDMDDESWNKQKEQMAKDTGVDLSNITRDSFIEKTTTEMNDDLIKEEFERTAFGTNGIMREFQASGGKLDEAAKIAILNNYSIMEPTFSTALKKYWEEYFAKIGIDMDMETANSNNNTTDTKQDIVSKLMNWGSKQGAMPNIPETKGGMANYGTTPTKYTNLSEEELYRLVESGDQEAIREAKTRGYF